jgi:hypothetical protein
VKTGMATKMLLRQSAAVLVTSLCSGKHLLAAWNLLLNLSGSTGIPRMGAASYYYTHSIGVDGDGRVLTYILTYRKHKSCRAQSEVGIAKTQHPTLERLLTASTARAIN